MLADIRPNEERARAFVVSNPKSTGVQTGPLMSEHEVSTTIECWRSNCCPFLKDGQEFSLFKAFSRAAG